MKKFLQHTSNRFGYSGWALMMVESKSILEWTVSTTREEVRQVRRDFEIEHGRDFFNKVKIVKVKIKVEAELIGGW